jgi:hypothetical protein
MVTSSLCAKLTNPVVPKISDSPTAHMAISSPKRRPSMKSWMIRPAPAPPLPVVPSERPKFTGWARPGATVTVRLSPPEPSWTSSGRSPASSVTSYWPSPGRSTDHWPRSSVST